MSISTRFTPLGAACCAVIIAAACAGDKSATQDSASGAVTPPATTAPRTVSLADVAGKWNMRAVPEAGDTTTTTYVLNATADTTGWTMTFPGGAPIPVHVRAEGDSILISAGPYDSVRRKGLKVRTNAIARIDGSSLVGTSVAHYATAGADSVLRLRISGTRVP